MNKEKQAYKGKNISFTEKQIQELYTFEQLLKENGLNISVSHIVRMTLDRAFPEVKNLLMSLSVSK